MFNRSKTTAGYGAVVNPQPEGVLYTDTVNIYSTSSGTPQQVLTSNGDALAPTFQPISGGGIVGLVPLKNAGTGVDNTSVTAFFAGPSTTPGSATFRPLQSSDFDTPLANAIGNKMTPSLQTYVDEATAAANNAENSASEAEASAVTAGNRANQAQTSATEAASSASAASTSATEASTAATTATEEATTAIAAGTEAVNAATAAAASATTAATSATEATTAAATATTEASTAIAAGAEAATSATAAAGSATAAAGSATAAAGSATTAAGSATAAAGSATSAAASATSAATSATSAATSATTATTEAVTATTQANIAITQATNAAASASAASTSATAASGSASAASTSATAASGSASAASSSAAAALASEGAAATSATAAAGSATAASGSAGAAAASATAAGASATAAGVSATAADGSAIAAGVSAVAAAASASSASGSASSASTSATNAQNYYNAISAPQNPNTVYSGPPSGSSTATPTFRALVAADIPNLDTGKLTSGVLSIARGGTSLSSIANGSVIVSNGSGGLTTITGTSGQVLQSNGTSAPSFQTLSGFISGLTTGYLVFAGSSTSVSTPVNITWTGSQLLMNIPAQRALVNATTSASTYGAGFLAGNSTGNALWSGIEGLGVANVNAGQAFFWATSGADTFRFYNGTSPTLLATINTSGISTGGTLVGSSLSLTNAISPNTFFGGPSVGSAAPSFRTLVASDIPSLDASIITSGALSTSFGGTGVSTSTVGQNNVLIGPNSGGAGAASFRALVLSDLPSTVVRTNGVNFTNFYVPFATGAQTLYTPTYGASGYQLEVSTIGTLHFYVNNQPTILRIQNDSGRPTYFAAVDGGNQLCMGIDQPGWFGTSNGQPKFSTDITGSTMNFVGGTSSANETLFFRANAGGLSTGSAYFKYSEGSVSNLVLTNGSNFTMVNQSLVWRVIGATVQFIMNVQGFYPNTTSNTGVIYIGPIPTTYNGRTLISGQSTSLGNVQGSDPGGISITGQGGPYTLAYNAGTSFGDVFQFYNNGGGRCTYPGGVANTFTFNQVIFTLALA